MPLLSYFTFHFRVCTCRMCLSLGRMAFYSVGLPPLEVLVFIFLFYFCTFSLVLAGFHRLFLCRVYSNFGQFFFFFLHSLHYCVLAFTFCMFIAVSHSIAFLLLFRLYIVSFYLVSSLPGSSFIFFLGGGAFLFFFCHPVFPLHNTFHNLIPPMFSSYIVSGMRCFIICFLIADV